MTNHLEIFTFGSLRFEVDGQTVSGFISRKVEALAVYVALEPREHPREVLAELLWPDQLPSRSLANLRSALFNLQKKLGDCIEVTRHAVRINPLSEIWIDASEFEQGLDLAKQKLATSEFLTRLGAVQVEALLELYQGEFLEGFYIKGSSNYEDWMVTKARYLREMVIEAHRWLVNYYARQLQYQAGIRYAQNLLQLDPLDEPTHRQIMIMLAQNGQRAAALAQYKTLQNLLDEELGVEPEDQTTELYAQLQAGDIPKLGIEQKLASDLPLSGTPFVGREVELAQVRHLLEDRNCRVLTVIGPGGIGKSRFAVQVALEHADEFQHGTYFCALAGVDSPNFLAPVIIETLGIVTQDNRSPFEQLLNYLQDKQLMLVIDNFEHMLSAANLLSQITARAVNVKVLVTSRERLNLQEEWLFPLNGFRYPLDIQAEPNENYEAVSFFIQAAQRVQPGFNPAKHMPAIAKICRLVEGFPLGLELAAAWLRLMSPTEVCNQISSGLDLLNSTSQNIPERHRSIRATFEGSWMLLSAEEQATLKKLSIFRGCFELSAAQTVANATPMLLGSLFDKSFLHRDADEWMSIHELIRRYSLEKLEADGCLTHMQEQHFAYYFDKVSRAAVEIETAKEREWLALLDSEIDNVFAALTYCLSLERYESYVSMICSLQVYWMGRGELWQEIRQRVRDVISKVKSESIQLQGTYLLGLLHYNLGDMPAAKQSFEQVIGSANASSMLHITSIAHSKLGWIAHLRGEIDNALRYLEHSVKLAELSENKIKIAETLQYLGRFYEKRGKVDIAEKYIVRSMQLGQESGYQSIIAACLQVLGNLSYKRSQLERAIGYFEEVYRIRQQLGDLQGQSRALDGLAMVTIYLNNVEYAYSAGHRALTISRKTGDRSGIVHSCQRLSGAEVRRGNFENAKVYLLEALVLAEEVGHEILGTTFLNLARVESKLGQLEKAAILYGIGQSLHENAKIGQSAPFRQELDEVVVEVRKQLSDAEYQRLFEIGSQMQIADGIQFATEGQAA